jgi:hypothetical protein
MTTTLLHGQKVRFSSAGRVLLAGTLGRMSREYRRFGAWNRRLDDLPATGKRIGLPLVQRLGSW